MKSSESIGNISAALIKARSAFPPILRTKEVVVKGDKGSYTFKYAPLEEILHAIQPHLSENGLTLMQGVEGFNLDTTILHTSGEWITHSMEMPKAYPSPRAFGSELTFRRRYSVTALLNLAAEEDDDGQEAERQLEKKKIASGSPSAFNRECYEKMNEEEQEFLRGIAASVIAMIDEDRVTEAYCYLEKQKLDDQEKPALWSLLDSKQRSAIKRAGDQWRREQQAAQPA